MDGLHLLTDKFKAEMDRIYTIYRIDTIRAWD